MRRISLLCLVLSACMALAVASATQRRPATQPNQFPRPNQNSGSPEKNKEVVLQVFNELFSQGRYNMISQIYHPDCVVHSRGRTSQLQEALAEGKGWRSAAPDLRMTANQISAAGDRVTVSWTAQGTNTGRGNELVKPTGKRINMHGTSIFRLSNGKIVEVWNEYDRNEIFRQLGVNPKVGQLYDMTHDALADLQHAFTFSDKTEAPSSR